MLERGRGGRQDGSMKIQLFLLGIVLIGFGLVLLNACATYPKSGQGVLVGTWTNSLGTVWMIKADGTFDVDLKHQGKRDAWGTYTVSGDTVTLQRTGGINPKGCKRPAIYKFIRTAQHTSHFTPLTAQCKLRIKKLTQPTTPEKKPT